MRMEFDNLRNDDEDLSTITGFVAAIQKVLRIRPGGLLWLGVPCSSFCWMAKATHQRSIQSPLGREDLASVELGNLLSCRAILLVMIAICRGVYWFIEQPALSALEFFPYLQYAMQLKTLNCALADCNTVRWLLVCIVMAHVLRILY